MIRITVYDKPDSPFDSEAVAHYESEVVPHIGEVICFMADEFPTFKSWKVRFVRHGILVGDSFKKQTCAEVWAEPCGLHGGPSS